MLEHSPAVEFPINVRFLYMLSSLFVTMLPNIVTFEDSQGFTRTHVLNKSVVNQPDTESMEGIG